MLVPVVWRVTTGQFAFTRLAASGLRPDEAMLSDAGYYGEISTEDAEAAIAIGVICERAEAVASAGQTSTGKKEGKKPDEPARKVAAAEVRPVEDTPAEPVPSISSVAVGAIALRCEGGMVRETLAGPGHEVCLCPGNTARRQTGERAYTCEGRYARRR